MILRALFFWDSEEFGQVSVDSERAFSDSLLICPETNIGIYGDTDTIKGFRAREQSICRQMQPSNNIPNPMADLVPLCKMTHA